MPEITKNTDIKSTARAMDDNAYKNSQQQPLSYVDLCEVFDRHRIKPYIPRKILLSHQQIQP